MFLIAGLGNPGKDYAGTRHNIGFEVIDLLRRETSIDINRAKFSAHFGEGLAWGKKIMLAMPQTYMNLSGRAIRDIVRFYKIPSEELSSRLIVIYDDADIPPGSVRIRQSGSHGGHNGIKDIMYQLETDCFIRVRVGIGEKPKGWDLADYVLSKFKPNEADEIKNGIEKAALGVEIIVKEGVTSAMNKFNIKNRKAAD